MIDRTWNRMRVSTPIEKRGWGGAIWPPHTPQHALWPLPSHGDGRGARACSEGV